MTYTNAYNYIITGVKHKISLTTGHDMVQKASASKQPIFLMHNDDDVIHIDVSDKGKINKVPHIFINQNVISIEMDISFIFADKSNWISLLPLGDASNANVWLYEEDNDLYGITVKSIAAGTPLTLGYTKPYAEDYAIPKDQPILDISESMYILL